MDKTIKSYQLIDTKTGRIIREVEPSQVSYLRRKADRMDNQYGAVRYVVRPVYN